ncbi:MAG: hypothetical protein ACKVHE_37000 [Planctomycetales bacterium]
MYRANRSDLPSFGMMLADQTGTGKTAEELNCSINEACEEQLYFQGWSLMESLISSEFDGRLNRRHALKFAN